MTFLLVDKYVQKWPGMNLGLYKVLALVSAMIGNFSKIS